LGLDRKRLDEIWQQLQQNLYETLPTERMEGPEFEADELSCTRTRGEKVSPISTQTTRLDGARISDADEGRTPTTDHQSLGPSAGTRGSIATGSPSTPTADDLHGALFSFLMRPRQRLRAAFHLEEELATPAASIHGPKITAPTRWPGCSFRTGQAACREVRLAYAYGAAWITAELLSVRRSAMTEPIRRALLFSVTVLEGARSVP
jgi:hypothetical protein